MQPRRKLEDWMPARAGELAALGLPVISIAAALGIHRQTLREWIQAGSSDTATELEASLTACIRAGRAEGERALVQRLINSQDTKGATWLLSHAPGWRETWSDAAAERRAVAAERGRMLQALEAAGLPAEIERRILLHLQAAGVGVDVPGLTDMEPDA